MANSVNQEQFYEAMGTLRDQIEAKHRSQREHIDVRCNAIEAVLKHHEAEDRAVEKRVTAIETDRSHEQKVAAKIGARRGAWAGAAVAAGLGLVVEYVKYAFGVPRS